MARRSFEVVDVTEILVHWHAGRSKSEISESLDVDRRTIAKYVAPAAAAGEGPGGPAGGGGRGGGAGGGRVAGGGGQRVREVGSRGRAGARVWTVRRRD